VDKKVVLKACWRVKYGVYRYQGFVSLARGHAMEWDYEHIDV
jgi:hypothetical protein